MILDTTFVIDLMRGKSSAIRKLEELKSRNEQVLLTPVTAYELFRGAEKYHNTEEERTEIRDALDKIPGEKKSLKWRHGRRSARLREELQADGNQIELTDIMIAAIAIEEKHAILTRNAKHFKKVEGVEVESY